MWSAAILAGGRARRFAGRDKTALLVDGRSILERQIAELSQITCDIMVVISDDRPAPAGAVRIVRDRVPGCGPLGGLHAALVEARGDATAVVAGDMPYVSARAVEFLLTLTRDADVVVPRTASGYHPLCAAYTRACLALVTRRLAAGRLKMTDLFADVRVREVTGEELDAFGDHRRLLANVNTPDDYRGLETFRKHQL